MYRFRKFIVNRQKKNQPGGNILPNAQKLLESTVDFIQSDFPLSKFVVNHDHSLMVVAPSEKEAEEIDFLLYKMVPNSRFTVFYK
jgi:hypothetical protein